MDDESDEGEYGEGGPLFIPYEPEEPEEVLNFVSSLIDILISNVIPEKPRALTLEDAGKCLRVLGKIWNLSEYSPPNFVHESLSDEYAGIKLMDMEGYIDDYQYLHIEAVDMTLTDIRILPFHFIWLLSADFSGNKLNGSRACPLTKLPNLVALKLNRNHIEDPYLPPMKHLQYLGLASNNIQSLHRIYHPNLETLNLNFNRIRKVNAEDCWKHTKLNQLELRGNLLKTTSGIEYSSLVNLYLAQNHITELKGLEILVNLQRLHLRENPLTSLEGFSSSNVNLKYLNVRKCQIPNLEEVKNLSVLTGLKELVVMSNPFSPEPERQAESEDDEDEEEEDDDEEHLRDIEPEDEEYDEMRITILTFIPSLTRIDKKLVTKEERHQMRDALMDMEE